MGTGYACMHFLSATREDIYKALPKKEREDYDRRLPEIKAKNKLLMEVVQRNIQSEQPSWKVMHKDKEDQLDGPATAITK
eukprot:CFRG6545T1